MIAQLDGVEAPARAWERDVLSARVDQYDASMLDLLCLTGAVAWARLSSGSASAPRHSGVLRRDLAEAFGEGRPTQVVGATPIALFLREHTDTWLALAERQVPPYTSEAQSDVDDVGRRFTRRLFTHLETHGASFANEMASACNLTDEELRGAIAELVACGAISSDGFEGLRAIVGTVPNRATARLNRASASGRWFLVRRPTERSEREFAIETLAWCWSCVSLRGPTGRRCSRLCRSSLPTSSASLWSASTGTIITI